MDAPRDRAEGGRSERVAHGSARSRIRHWRHEAGHVFAAIARVVHPTPLGRALDRRLRLARQVHVARLPVPGLEPRLAGLRVALVSDVHAGHFLTADDALALADEVVAARPDLVALVGDLPNTRWEEVRILDRAIERLRDAAPLGVFAVPGNHEYYRPSDFPRLRAHLEGIGVRVLVNEGIRVHHGGTTLWLGGADDLTESTPDLDAALRNRAVGETTVLLAHHPDLFVEAAARGVHLQLSGHTHGGQIRLGSWAPITHSRHGFVSGVYRRGRSVLYLGRGVGVVVLPLRIGTRGELPILELAEEAGGGSEGAGGA